MSILKTALHKLQQRAQASPVRTPPAVAPGQRRIAYLSPDSKLASGGVKVIYQHAQALRALGFDAHVMHMKRGFRCDWFEHQASILHLKQLQASDLAIVPEMMPQVAAQVRQRGNEHCMFVQNGYLVTATCDYPVALHAHQHARAILSISEDTSELLRQQFPSVAERIVRVVCSVDRGKFSAGGPKQPVVTYMPRKMPLHARHVTQWLAASFPHWRFVALDGLSEDAVAQALRASRIFLSFSEFEGFGLPPVEAALAGNLVLGYDGWGGREYWQAPNFHAVPYGDVRRYASVFATVERLARQDNVDALLQPGIGVLASRYNHDTEVDHLQRLMRGLGLVAGAPSTMPASPRP